MDLLIPISQCGIITTLRNVSAHMFDEHVARNPRPINVTNTKLKTSATDFTDWHGLTTKNSRKASVKIRETCTERVEVSVANRSKV